MKRAEAHVGDAGANVTGIVLNSVNVHRMDYCSYGYSHYDAHPEEANQEEDSK